MEKPTDAGKLILLHGEPGTGKTTAIRALIRHLQCWCRAQYISDPERVFSSPVTRPGESRDCIC
ncbi:AAA family ATPase [Mycolicibacterium moriokaense]|uniref:AAA family ATPase n=1 Tax=Mycolicibacterium moriokaense TaxID=39691 RepID=UPI0038996321